MFNVPTPLKRLLNQDDLKEVKTKYTMIFSGTTNNNYREVPEPPHFRLHYTPTLANLSCQSCDYIYSYKLTMISVYMYSPISVCRDITVIEILCFGREYFLYLKAFLGEKQCDPLFHEGGIRTPHHSITGVEDSYHHLPGHLPTVYVFPLSGVFLLLSISSDSKGIIVSNTCVRNHSFLAIVRVINGLSCIAMKSFDSP